MSRPGRTRSGSNGEEERQMTRIDWSVLSGPRVSRRTMMKLAAATGAFGFAGRLAPRASAAGPGRRAGGPRRLVRSRRQGGTLKLGFGISQIPTLDPAQVNLGIIAGELVANLFSSLVQFDDQLGLGSRPGRDLGRSRRTGCSTPSTPLGADLPQRRSADRRTTSSTPTSERPTPTSPRPTPTNCARSPRRPRATS